MVSVFWSRFLEQVDAAVAIPIASRLFSEVATGVTVENRLSMKSIDERMNVWVAVGMSVSRLQLRNNDALALLRGYAYSHNSTLDQVARLVTDRASSQENS